MLSSRQHLSKEPLNEGPAPEPQMTVPAGTTTPLPAPESRVVVITARPSVQFVDGELPNVPIPYGTILLRESEDRWVGGYRAFTDSEVRRLLGAAHAVERNIPAMSTEGVQQYNQGVRDILARTAALQGAVSANRVNTQAAVETSLSAFQRVQEEMMQSLQRPMQDFQRVMEDLTRTFPLGPGTNASSQTTVVRTRSTVGNTRQGVMDPRPEPAAKAAPKPKPNTPKRAIDRLLEDDLIVDDDSGVKPES